MKIDKYLRGSIKIDTFLDGSKIFRFRSASISESDRSGSANSLRSLSIFDPFDLLRAA